MRAFDTGGGQIGMQQSATKSADQNGGAARLLYACRICSHANIPDSTFCSACGTPFLSAPCPQCGAANLATKSFCSQCHAALARRAAAEEPVSRRPVRLTTVVLAASAAVVTILAILGYSAYEMLSFGHIPLDRKTLPPVPPSATHAVPDGAGRAIATDPPAEGRQAVEREAPRSGSCLAEARVLGLCTDSGPGRK